MAKNSKSTLEWLAYYVEKAREEGYSVEARAERLTDEGVSEGTSF